MPELAEVEFFRKQWDAGLDKRIAAVLLHPDKRVFRGTDAQKLQQVLPGSRLLASEAHGKQMLFRFSHGIWLGLHLGMTGKLRVAEASFKPSKHDHLVLCQKGCALVFNDARQFGRVLFHQGSSPPPWWRNLAVDVRSKSFTAARMEAFLQRHRKLPIKAALLLQTGFPGVGNWMADEILWRSGLHPRTSSGQIRGTSLQKLWRELRHVCREAVKIVGKDYSDPPVGWLFQERWKRDGLCPIHKRPLRKETVGGRTSAWCPKCQAQR
ncbi:MAG: DNA-formamidopyrimidine glycosylase family protein [Verrucomicrobiota bacterium]